MYFAKFPDLYYQYNIKGKDSLHVVKDITHNVRFRKEVLANITLFDQYDIQDGDTPDIIAAKYYGSSDYHWVIMLCNDKYDWRNDFPLNAREFDNHIASTYTNPQGIHHYENSNGLVVDQSYPGRTVVTNYDFEYRRNETKRRIKLISREMLSQIVSNFKSII